MHRCPRLFTTLPAVPASLSVWGRAVATFGFWPSCRLLSSGQYAACLFGPALRALCSRCSTCLELGSGFGICLLALLASFSSLGFSLYQDGPAQYSSPGFEDAYGAGPCLSSASCSEVVALCCMPCFCFTICVLLALLSVRPVLYVFF